MLGHFNSSRLMQVCKCVFTKTKTSCTPGRRVSKQVVSELTVGCISTTGRFHDQASLGSYPVLEAPKILKNNRTLSQDYKNWDIL